MSQEQKLRVAEACAQVKEASERLKTAKSGAKHRLTPLYQAVDRAAYEAQLKARAASGVYHQTYQLIEDAAKASRKALAKHLAPDNDPRLRSYPRPYGDRVKHIAEGRLGMVSGGKRVKVAEAFAGDNNWLRISPISADAYHLPRGERQRATRARVSFRVGSWEDRSPIWATFSDVQIHRELPADGVITLAWAKLRLRGDRKSDQRWEIQLTIEAPSTDSSVTQQAHGRPGSVAAINLGWRVTEEGTRVAYVVDDEGAEREICYAARARSRAGIEGGDRFAKIDSVKSIRGKAFDAARAALVAYLSELGDRPEPFASSATHLDQWRSSSRLVSLVREWSQKRHDGDAKIFSMMRDWMHQDAHLYQWETRMRDRTVGARRDYYRQVARQLCRTYETIVIGDVALTALAARKAPEKSDDDPNIVQRRNRSRAAPSEFAAALKLIGPKFGTRIAKVSAQNITKTCHRHPDSEIDRRPSIMVRWSKCGCVHDQDANACRNLLARFFGCPGGDESGGDAGKNENNKSLDGVAAE